jgi:hypothetical protein
MLKFSNKILYIWGDYCKSLIEVWKSEKAGAIYNEIISFVGMRQQNPVAPDLNHHYNFLRTTQVHCQTLSYLST